MGFLLAALICNPVWGAVPPQPGSVNYVEGQASIGGQPLGANSAGSATLMAGQSLSTQNGRAEILLTPGVLFRISNNSTVNMISPDLANTVLLLQKGRALVEVTDIRPESSIRINENGASTLLRKPGLYEIDADHGQVRVFDGNALIQSNGREVELKGGRQLALNSPDKPKPQKFDKQAYQDDFYRWASLRSSYLTEANADAASRYSGASGASPTIWAGTGWYWDPAFDAYTFIPGDGIFYSPFGWAYYSPLFAFGAPGVGYFGYFGGIHHHFGPGYHPHYAGAYGFPGHASHWNGNGFRPGGMAAGVRGGGFHPASGFHAGGGGFHGSAGGGFRGGGGGFHGGGGGFHGGGGGHGGGGHR
jgi:hypothetical protein